MLITGTVGQGKSIFLRYLCVGELRQGQRVPIFIELRSIDDQMSLEKLLIYKLQLLGLIDVTPEALDFLFADGTFVFFLDGFDEVKRQFVIQTQQQLRLLMTKFPQTQWIISSRPGSLREHLQQYPD